MDNDPQEEIVIEGGSGQIIIVDGLTGKIDWDSGPRYDYATYTDFPFIDLGQGLKGFVLEVKDLTTNVTGVCIVGLKGGVGGIEAQKFLFQKKIN